MTLEMDPAVYSPNEENHAVSTNNQEGTAANRAEQKSTKPEAGTN